MVHRVSIVSRCGTDESPGLRTEARPVAVRKAREAPPIRTVKLLTKSYDLANMERMKTVNVHTAKTHLSRLLDRVHGGEEIVIAKSGKPYARLVPLQSRQPERRSGTLKGSVEITKAFFEPLPSGWSGED